MLKTPEQLLKERFGFDFIDDIQPQQTPCYGTQENVNWIKSIQEDAYREGYNKARYDYVEQP